MTIILTEAQIANLRTACATSNMRGHGEWSAELDALAKLLWQALQSDAITLAAPKEA